ncbi:ATP phosphoribosyltransferase [Patescibacteria group bacterium]|nr:ATP phosphoribosyltransferase [Patescibacteria group bacterium]
MSQIDIVVPDGSMQEVIVGLFAKAGLPVVIEKRRTKEGKVEVDWIKRVAFQRPQEIPKYLKSGHFDVAIVGEDWIANWGYEFPVLLKLPIGRSGNKPVKIVLAVNQASDFRQVEELPQSCEVATEYVQLVQRFFIGLGRDDIKVVPSFGNTEHKIGFGATAIVDVTESGDSLKENQLEIICEIMESNTVVVANSESLADESKRPYIDCFIRLINGAFQASKRVMLVANVPKNVLDEASRIIGGLKGPSCSPLVGVKGWFALQSVVAREDEQKIIFELLQIGVTDIIVNRDIPLIMS